MIFIEIFLRLCLRWQLMKVALLSVYVVDAIIHVCHILRIQLVVDQLMITMLGEIRVSKTYTGLPSKQAYFDDTPTFNVHRRCI